MYFIYLQKCQISANIKTTELFCLLNKILHNYHNENMITLIEIYISKNFY